MEITVWSWFWLLSGYALLLSTRLYPWMIERGKRATVGSGDECNHLIIRNMLRRGENPEATFLMEGFDYPTAFHQLSLVFSDGMVKRLGGLLPLLFDTCLYLCSAALLIHVGAGINWVIALFVLCGAFFIHVGRNIHFSERAFGALWGNLYLVSMCLINEAGWSPVMIGIAGVFFIGAALASKFAVQAILFISVVYAIIAGTLSPIILLFICQVLGAVLSLGRTLRIQYGIWRHSYFYARYIQKVNPATANQIRAIYLHLKAGDFKAAVKCAMWSPYGRIFFLYPIAVGGVIIALLSPDKPTAEPFILLVAAGLIVAVIIAIPRLLFLGEPERYIEYVTIGAIVGASFYFPKFDWGRPGVLVPLLFYGAGCSLAFYMHYKQMLQYVRTGTQEEIPEFSVPMQNKRILTIPVRIAFPMALKGINAQYVAMLTNIGDPSRQALFERVITDFYPYPSSELESLINSEKIDIVVVKETALSKINALSGKNYYDFSRLKLLERIGDYAVYRGICEGA
ncbi:hypothetical protein [Achromobacter dolens]|uniref:hypothetical protein n=2 Tax=Pseudomonadota TaxID=1224 RepID=UPI0006C076B9|nr:hypothetical protein [Achromobacter dolens]CUI28968.1 Uncharacterised protein [Achromobacter dolens]